MANLAATVGTFLVGTRLAGQNWVDVPSVYPPFFNASITGGVTAGDGHVALGTPGTQFGAPTVKLGGPPQTASVSGVGSAQQFGVVLPRAGVATRTVGSVASAQSFGTIRTAFGIPVTGVLSAQAFGTVRANVRLVSGGVSTAQAFGVPKTAYRITVTGVASAQAFGAPQVRLTTAVQLTGVASAQSFGTIRVRVVVTVGSVASAQQFGTPRASYRFRVNGVPSAQQFGIPDAWLKYLDDVVCGDEDLDPLYCLDTADAPICGEHITGEVVAGQVIVVGGSVRFLDDFACLTSPSAAVLNEFLCGDGTLIGGDPWNMVAPSPPDIVLTPARVIDLALTESR